MEQKKKFSLSINKILKNSLRIEEEHVQQVTRIFLRLNFNNIIPIDFAISTFSSLKDSSQFSFSLFYHAPTAEAQVLISSKNHSTLCVFWNDNNNVRFPCLPLFSCQFIHRKNKRRKNIEEENKKLILNKREVLMGVDAPFGIEFWTESKNKELQELCSINYGGDGWLTGDSNWYRFAFKVNF